MGKKIGVGETEFSILGDRVGSGLLQGVDRRIKTTRSISYHEQKRIDRILEEMKRSSDRMERLLGVFNRMNRGQ